MSVPPNHIRVTDHAGKSVDLPLERGFFAAGALRDALGVRSFDSGLANTAIVRSAICSIDGAAGTLHYRGYPIEQLVQHASFTEVAYLLIHGELPTQETLGQWDELTLGYSMVHEDIKSICSQFRHDAHPMGFLVSTCAALGTFYPEANPALQGRDLYARSPALVNQLIYRVLGKLPTLAACAYRHRMGRPYNLPATGEDATRLGYSGNFLMQLDRLSEERFEPHPVLVRALDKLFIIHAEHGLNASTTALRHVSSSGSDLWSCVSAACASLYGPLHGGANQAVLEMLARDVRTVANIPAFLERVKKREVRLMGFGHRVYRTHDPRVSLIRDIAKEVFDVCGRDPLIEVAEALAEAALKDDYFVSRKLYPNVDYYTGMIYSAIGFPTDMFPVLFALGRVAGWLAHWKESIHDKDTKLYRPTQLYTGPKPRVWLSLDKRAAPSSLPDLRPLSTSDGRVRRRRLLSKL